MHDNKKKIINTKISQGFLLSSIFFLIYISRIFIKVSKTSSLAMSLFFMNDLGFIALGSFIKEIVKAYKNIAKEIIE